MEQESQLETSRDQQFDATLLNQSSPEKTSSGQISMLETSKSSIEMSSLDERSFDTHIFDESSMQRFLLETHDVRLNNNIFFVMGFQIPKDLDE